MNSRLSIHDNRIFFSKIIQIYVAMWKNIVKLGRPQITIWRMRIACKVTKAINTHSEYVIFTAVPLQQ
jgi:CRISPR/Cas system-associated endonuclease Cas1